MAATLDERTVLPPGADRAAAYRAILRELPPPPGNATLVGPDGRGIELPPDVYVVLRQVLSDLANGFAVTIQPSNAVLTTQQAADMLHVSRPTLVKLLEEGKIQYTKHGRHRRIALEDVLAYDEHARAARRTELAEPSYESARDGTDDESNEFFTTR